jgi:hypothetical protein
MLDAFMQHREYVRCRTFGHSWDDIPVTETDPDGPQFWLRCVNCHSVRRDTFHRMTGELIRRKYDYPDHYQLSGDEVPTRDEFRLQLFTIVSDLQDRRAAKRVRKAS